MLELKPVGVFHHCLVSVSTPGMKGEPGQSGFRGPKGTQGPSGRQGNNQTVNIFCLQERPCLFLKPEFLKNYHLKFVVQWVTRGRCFFRFNFWFSDSGFMLMLSTHTWVLFDTLYCTLQESQGETRSLMWLWYPETLVTTESRGTGDHLAPRGSLEDLDLRVCCDKLQQDTKVVVLLRVKSVFCCAWLQVWRATLGRTVREEVLEAEGWEEKQETEDRLV